MAAIGKELILGYQLRPRDSTLQHSFLLQPVEEERKENQSVIPVFNDLLLQAILGGSLRLKVKSMENARCDSGQGPQCMCLNDSLRLAYLAFNC